MDENRRSPVDVRLSDLNGIMTGNISDAQDKTGHMAAHILPLYASARLLAPACTVLCAPRDNLAVHRAIERAYPGEVLVVANGGCLDTGFFGGIMATACTARGIAGLVTDGACRDSDEFQELGFPVFAAGRSPGGTRKDDPGYVNVPVICGGVLVRPGDFVFADSDGVVVIAATRVIEVLARARASVDHEREVRGLLSEGQTTMDIYSFPRNEEPELIRRDGCRRSITTSSNA